MFSPVEAQRRAFALQLEAAVRLGRPLFLHCRDAFEDFRAMLRDAASAGARGVAHCFTGGPADARECLDRGAFLSFSGIVTFKTAADVQDAARLCPLDRMLAETDSPYLAPNPHRGRTNQPAFVTHVVAFLAALRGVPLDSVRAATAEAAFRALPCLGIGGGGS
jgi:TatD DNase family protein